MASRMHERVRRELDAERGHISNTEHTVFMAVMLFISTLLAVVAALSHIPA